MKILWFANTPCCATEKLSPDLFTGGWLSSLEEQLVNVKDIDLSVSFYWGEKLDPFKFQKTTYYPVFRPGTGSKAGRFMLRMFNRAHSDTKEIQKLLKIIVTVKPDVIHIHGTEDNFGLIQLHTTIPVVISLQGILTPYCEKFFSGIPLLPAFWYEGLKPKLLFYSITSIYKKMRKSAKREQIIFRNSKFIIGRTDWDRRVINVFAPNSQYFIGNELLRPAFYKKQWDKEKFNNPLIIVTVMSYGLYKGLETIVQTAKVLCENNLLNFKWIVIGQNEKGDLARIVKRWLKVDFIKLNICLVGHKSEMELVRYNAKFGYLLPGEPY